MGRICNLLRHGKGTCSDPLYKRARQAFWPPAEGLKDFRGRASPPRLQLWGNPLVEGCPIRETRKWAFRNLRFIVFLMVSYQTSFQVEKADFPCSLQENEKIENGVMAVHLRKNNVNSLQNNWRYLKMLKLRKHYQRSDVIRRQSNNFTSIPKFCTMSRKVKSLD